METEIENGVGHSSLEIEDEFHRAEEEKEPLALTKQAELEEKQRPHIAPEQKFVEEETQVYEQKFEQENHQTYENQNGEEQGEECNEGEASKTEIQDNKSDIKSEDFKQMDESKFEHNSESFTVKVEQDVPLSETQILEQVPEEDGVPMEEGNALISENGGLEPGIVHVSDTPRDTYTLQSVDEVATHGEHVVETINHSQMEHVGHQQLEGVEHVDQGVASYVEYTFPEPRDGETTVQVEYLGPADMPRLAADATIEYITLSGDITGQDIGGSKVIGVLRDSSIYGGESYSLQYLPVCDSSTSVRPASGTDPLQAALESAKVDNDPMSFQPIGSMRTLGDQTVYQDRPDIPPPPPPFDDPPLMQDPYDRQSPMYTTLTTLENASMSSYSTLRPSSPSKTGGLSAPYPTSLYSPPSSQVPGMAGSQGFYYPGQSQGFNRNYPVSSLLPTSSSLQYLDSGPGISGLPGGIGKTELWSPSLQYGTDSFSAAHHHSQPGSLLPDSMTDVFSKNLGNYGHYVPSAAAANPGYHLHQTDTSHPLPENGLSSTNRYSAVSSSQDTSDPFGSSAEAGDCLTCGAQITGRVWRRDSGSQQCDSCATYSKMNGIRPTTSSGGARSPPARSKVASSGTGNRRTGMNCANCNTNTTTLWRRNNQGEPVCNACGLYFKLHGINRPPSKKNDGIRSRKRKPKNPGVPKEPRKQSKSKPAPVYNNNPARKLEEMAHFRLEPRADGGAMKMEMVMEDPRHAEANMMPSPQDMVLSNIKHSQEVLMANLKSSEDLQHSQDLLGPNSHTKIEARIGLGQDYPNMEGRQNVITSLDPMLSRSQHLLNSTPDHFRQVVSGHSGHSGHHPVQSPPHYSQPLSYSPHHSPGARRHPMLHSPGQVGSASPLLSQTSTSVSPPTGPDAMHM